MFLSRCSLLSCRTALMPISWSLVRDLVWDARCRPLHPDHRGTDMEGNGHNVAVVFPLEPELPALRGREVEVEVSGRLEVRSEHR